MDKFGFGLMRLPTLDGDNGKIDYDHFTRMVDAFMAAGGKYFDTAYFYHDGHSEEAFREVVAKRYPRERFTITDKMPIYMVKEAADLPRLFQEQLERCGVEYFDYYWLHAMSAERYTTALNTGAFEFLAQKKQEGKIRHIGFSFHDTPEVLEQILSEQPCVEYVQLQINYMDWEDPSVQARRCYEIACAHNVPVIVMEPIKGGLLAQLPEQAQAVLQAVDPQASMASWAVRYTASLDNVMMVLSGMSNDEQMADNLSYMQDFRPLQETEQAALAQVTQILRQRIAVDCTKCRYCVSENTCPADIPIPNYFSMYNEKMQYNNAAPHTYFRNLSAKRGKASDCVGCGQCEAHCPQHLPIREHLQQVAQAFE